MASYDPVKITRLKALHDSVIVADMEFAERFTQSGIYIPSDNGTGTGIKPRWGRVYAVGPEHRDVVPGQWVLVEHGRWTRGIDIEDAEGKKTIRRVDPDCLLLVSDEDPVNIEGVSDSIDGRYMQTSINDFARDGL